MWSATEGAPQRGASLDIARNPASGSTRKLGEEVMRGIVDGVRGGELAPVIGETVEFEALLDALTRMRDPQTTGRVIVTLGWRFDSQFDPLRLEAGTATRSAVRLRLTHARPG